MAPCSEFVVFEAEVRRQFTAALTKLREMGKRTALNDRPICVAVEAEEQSRLVAFQQCLMGGPTEAYQSAVQSTIQNILNNLALLGGDPGLFQGATQCLSDYMSALNHHSSVCMEEPKEERGLEVGFGGKATPRDRRGSAPTLSTGSTPNRQSQRRGSLPSRQNSGSGSSPRSSHGSTSGAHQKLPMLPPGVSEDTVVMPKSPWHDPFRRFGHMLNWLAALVLSVIFGYVLFEFCVNGDAISSLERSRTWRATGCQRQGEPVLVTRRLYWGRGHLGALGEHRCASPLAQPPGMRAMTAHGPLVVLTGECAGQHPHLASPHLASPHLASPHLALPHLALCAAACRW